MEKFALGAVAVTRGARGSVLMTPDHLEVHHGVRAESVENTLGASDAFTAALVMGLLQGWPLGEISERANQLASQVCTSRASMPPHAPRVQVAFEPAAGLYPRFGQFEHE